MLRTILNFSYILDLFLNFLAWNFPGIFLAFCRVYENFFSCEPPDHVGTLMERTYFCSVSCLDFDFWLLWIQGIGTLASSPVVFQTYSKSSAAVSILPIRSYCKWHGEQWRQNGTQWDSYSKPGQSLTFDFHIDVHLALLVGCSELYLEDPYWE